jgi:hypothetical protein
MSFTGGISAFEGIFEEIRDGGTFKVTLLSLPQLNAD